MYKKRHLRIVSGDGTHGKQGFNWLRCEACDRLRLRHSNSQLPTPFLRCLPCLASNLPSSTSSPHDQRLSQHSPRCAPISSGQRYADHSRHLSRCHKCAPPRKARRPTLHTLSMALARRTSVWTISPLRKAPTVHSIDWAVFSYVSLCYLRFRPPAPYSVTSFTLATSPANVAT